MCTLVIVDTCRQTLSISLSNLSRGHHPAEMWAGLFWKDGLRETLSTASHILLTHCLCVFLCVHVTCLRATELHAHLSQTCGNVWVLCISKEVGQPRECECSHEHTATSISKANHFSILPSQTVMSQTEWVNEKGKKEKKDKQKDRGDCSWKAGCRAPLVFFKSTTNSSRNRKLSLQIVWLHCTPKDCFM